VPVWPDFSIASLGEAVTLSSSFLITNTLNSELCKKALEKVGNPNVLINLVSRRVRQLNAGSGPMSRPLLADTANMGAADIALMELIEEKTGWDLPEHVEADKPANNTKKRAKKH
jgi:DNA-directed RNA polymerase subunit omega